ncbi:allophanate hydrolase [Alkalilimnicola ehrlichii]|uniref:Allophanate hydrolase n=1 Tax=Alkalilimnicola ehrlichii TaxID=351052 RepID=A0A3E0X247_9GAMM|nr:allophanate hydrolase [Alkalilimnicola ehrlichii]RFA30949.1 allophanate hydrolase [Alkalilimnicola ehrlichii]RFA38899.1 allophanate hydrolase [Alkalilimnicola ehrlichii]
MPTTLGWTIKDWQQAYRDGAKPEELVGELLDCLDDADSAWISRLDKQMLNKATAELAKRLAAVGGDVEQLPLYGIPFAVKDNIDVVGFDTTAACPAFGYRPDKDAAVVRKLKAAGAIPIGKTNLDQFATGLVGTRSPYGAVPNTFKPEVISGGSSSGSASVVARGLVPFSLGTDTAGSGRVPAGLNNVVGLKPTKGLLSIDGVVPACRSLDCVSVFALTVNDAARATEIMAGFEPSDAFSRKPPASLPLDAPAIRRAGPVQRIAIPEAPLFFDDRQAEAAWNTVIGQWRQLNGAGIELVALDFGPLLELAALLYEGPWVAERHAAVEHFMAAHGDEMNAVVRGIIGNADKFTATATFKAQYRKEALLRQIDELLTDVDALLVPTAPIAPTIAAVKADPVTLNSRLGTYTNFVNLADFCALAIPAGFRDDGLPFGVTLIGGAWKDRELQAVAGQWLNAYPTTLGATDKPRPAEAIAYRQAVPTVQVAVVGAHLSGMPLNIQLTERRARLLEQTTTSPRYRLYALPNTTPPKPGLKRVKEGGREIVLEVWEMAASEFGSFVDLIPAPLGIGNVELVDGRWVNGFVCEDYGFNGADDVTEFGGWRAYIADLQSAKA